MKKLLFISIILFFHFNSFSTHIVGGDISVKYISGNTFEVTLKFYRDCLNGQAGFDLPSIQLGLYDKVTNAPMDTIDLPFISSQVLTLGDSCYTPTGICVEEGIYRTNVTIANNANGYYISWQRCCRNGIITNITAPGNAGMVFYAEVPNPTLMNSTPTFGAYPNAYFCASTLNTQNFSCTDIDGDQLVYSLITPLNGNANSVAPLPPPSAGPYSSITWLAPYSATDMVGGTPVMSINSSTGILTASPTALGTYVFAVRVEEYRAGVKIGEIRRDIQYQVINCPSNQAPAFTQPATDSSTITIVAGDSLCLNVLASDPNPDWLTLTASNSEIFNLGFGDFPLDSAQSTVQSSLCVYPKCEHIRDAPYHVTLYVKDSTCYGSNVVRNEIDIIVAPPPLGSLDLIPNVFTPNGDNKNDEFKVATSNVSTCFDEFNIIIYNRWGIKVYESTNFYFQWDGRITNGMKAKDGIYFYIINAKFRDTNSTYKGQIHLYR